jgi:hypothetical protein
LHCRQGARSGLWERARRRQGSCRASAETGLRGSGRPVIDTYPAKRSLAEIKARVRRMTRGATDLSLTSLLRRLNPVQQRLDCLLAARGVETDLVLPAALCGDDPAGLRGDVTAALDGDAAA